MQPTATTRDEFSMDPVLGSSAHRILITVLLAASLVPIWSVTYFPSQNGPWHLLVAKMLRDYVAGTDFNYFDYYEVVPHLIPHLLHTLLVTLASFAVPILTAHQLVISLYAVLLPLSVFSFLSAVDRRRTIYGYASFLFVYNLPLMRGYHDYALGIPVVLFTLAYWLRTRERPSRKRSLTLSGLILLAYLSHIFNFLILGLAISLFTLYETRSLRRVMVALLVFVPALLLAVDFAVLLMRNSVWVDRSDLEIFWPHQAAEHFLRFVYTLSPSAGIVLLIPFVFVAYAVVRTLWRGLAEYRSTRQIAGGAYLLLLGVLGSAYLVMPHKFVGWHYANTRFIPYVLVAALACASPTISLPLRRTFIATVAAAAVVAHALLAAQAIRADREIQEYVSGLERFQQNGILYPIEFHTNRFGQIRPLTRAYEYYHIFRGGANGQGIAKFNTLTPIPYRMYPVRRRFPVWRPWNADRAAARLADTYDHVISWGTDPRFTESLAQAKFRLVYQRGRLYLYENANGRAARMNGDAVLSQ